MRASTACLGKLLPPEAIVTTTTSSLSVAELAAASGRPDRFGALHVFNPVEKMKLVELSFPDEATAETKLELHRLCERLEKTAVEVPDAAGFVVNKLLFPYLFDAVRLLERDGIDAAGHRHLHEARRRATRWARWRCSTSSASTWPRRSASRSAPRSPTACAS